MISAALLALRDATTRPFRLTLVKSVGLALLLLILLGIGLETLAARLIALENSYADTGAAILTGLGIFFALLFLVPPVVSLVAGLFLDQIAERVERTHYPGEAPGRELPVVQSLWLSSKFALVVLGVNLLALFLLLIPGINILAWWLANGYLLGREYFELAALRFRPLEEARALRRTHRGMVFLGGLMIAAFMAIPILNLATPLVGTAFMVHLHKRLGGRTHGGGVFGS